MSEPTPQVPAAPSGAAVPTSEAGEPTARSVDEGLPPPADADLPAPALVPGDRLAPPLGATRVVADYGRPRPSYVFLALGSILTLASDMVTKAWASRHLEGGQHVVVIKNYLELVLAKNRGGAWGLLQSTSENVRRPFFLLVSVAAIIFIVTLYRRLQPRQRALKWGLPLVFGGALGNVLDRIRDGHVVDFIDAYVIRGGIEHHWPTFNVADIAICVGVGLMAIDMFASKRGRGPAVPLVRVPPAQSGELVPLWSAPSSQAAGSDLHGVEGGAAGDASVADTSGASHPLGDAAPGESDAHR